MIDEYELGAIANEIAGDIVDRVRLGKLPVGLVGYEMDTMVNAFLGNGSKGEAPEEEEESEIEPPEAVPPSAQAAPPPPPPPLPAAPPPPQPEAPTQFAMPTPGGYSSFFMRQMPRMAPPEIYQQQFSPTWDPSTGSAPPTLEPASIDGLGAHEIGAIADEIAGDITDKVVLGQLSPRGVRREIDFMVNEFMGSLGKDAAPEVEPPEPPTPPAPVEPTPMVAPPPIEPSGMAPAGFGPGGGGGAPLPDPGLVPSGPPGSEEPEAEEKGGIPTGLLLASAGALLLLGMMKKGKKK